MTICYPSLYKVNTKATIYGQKKESDATKAYEASLKVCHVNLGVKKCELIHFFMPPLIFLRHVTVVEVDAEKLNVQ